MLISTTIRATPAVAPKLEPPFYIWVPIPIFVGPNLCFHSNSSPKMKTPKSILVDNDIRGPLVIGSNLSSSPEIHPTYHDACRTSTRLCRQGCEGRARAAKQRVPSPHDGVEGGPHGGAEGSSGPAHTRRRRRRRGRRRGGKVTDAMAGGARSSLRMPGWRRRGQAPWQGGAKGRSRRALRPCLPWI